MTAVSHRGIACAAQLFDSAGSAELLALLHPGADEPSATFLGGARRCDGLRDRLHVAADMACARAACRGAPLSLEGVHAHTILHLAALPRHARVRRSDRARRAKVVPPRRLVWRPARAVIPASDRRYAIGGHDGGTDVDSTAWCAGLPHSAWRRFGTRGARDKHAERHFLYVAEPGIRNYVEYGGVGVLVFDMDRGYRFVRRIPTFEVAPGKEPDNVKGIAAHADDRPALCLDDQAYGRLRSVDRQGDLESRPTRADATAWRFHRTASSCMCRPSKDRTGSPSMRQTGDVVAKIVTNSGAHNTIYGPDGHRVYLAGLHSPLLSIADPATHTVVATVGPFGNSIRPFTINAGADALLRERQRAARVRGRRHAHREDAASRRGDGLHQGTREAAWLPEPRHRPDAGREGAVAGGRRQQQGCTSSTRP